MRRKVSSRLIFVANRNHILVTINIERRLPILFLIISYSLLAISSKAQAPRSLSSSEILQQIKKLKVLGSVLYIAAHPDDENTRMLAWLANEKQYRTGYLSLTRGDGGQNLIGDEQGTELGLIRTQELLAARRMDGAEQFFSRAFDFGFSKTADETMRIWGHDKILSDVVWVIRQFRPDIIITRFPPDSRAGHGNHTASAMLAIEAFDAAADPKRFPEQLKNYGIEPWQAKRLFWNSFGGASGEGQTISVDAGGYNALLGKSYGEIAAESRTNHKSQGFGTARTRGAAPENLTLMKGSLSGTDPMGAVDVSWNRIGAANIEKNIDSVVAGYNPANPAASVLELINIYKQIDRLDDIHSYWRDKKLAELKEIILACAGVYAEAVSSQQFIGEGNTLHYSVNVINRSMLPVEVKINPSEAPESFKTVTQSSGKNAVVYTANRLLDFNKSITIPARREIGQSFLQTQPYWLRLGMEPGSFTVNDQKLIGRPENEPLQVALYFFIDSSLFLYVNRPILFKQVDPVRGELYNPVIITPKEKVYSNNNLVLFRKDRPSDSAQIVISVAPEESAAAQKIALQLTSNHLSFSKPVADFKPVSGIGQNFTIRLNNYLQKSGAEKDTLQIQLQKTDSKQVFANASRTISYDHIPTINYFYRDAIQVLNIDLKTVGKAIGYIPGAGDKVPDALRQMGYTVTELTNVTTTPELLKTFDAIVTGIRAYDVNDWLFSKYDMLMQYIRDGGNLIVQYNRNEINQSQTKIAPYPFTIANKRVSEENAAVTFAQPNSPVLNYPNKITQKDFAGWIQERSTYQGETSDSHYATPLTMHDTGEAESSGSLLIAPYGKGNFVYASLVFFRELPAGVPGAYRLMANLIALGK